MCNDRPRDHARGLKISKVAAAIPTTKAATTWTKSEKHWRLTAPRAGHGSDDNTAQ